MLFYDNKGYPTAHHVRLYVHRLSDYSNSKGITSVYVYMGREVMAPYIPHLII
jgi:hypothetical protein